MSENRKLKYALAINEAFHQLMAVDDSVILIGQGLESPWYVGRTAEGLSKRFGKARVFDTPISENAVTGAAVGAAMCGMKAVVVHPRMDFMLYAMDPIINEAANWHTMFGGRINVPVVFWGIINRGGEQGAQHSQALHALFSHIPGLKVVMPATPADAKGLMVAAIRHPHPVVYIDDRWLHGTEGHVPQEIVEVPIGKARIVVAGQDVTIAAVSYMVPEAVAAAAELSADGIRVEVLDIRTAKPLDRETLLASVKKTGRLVVADVGWKSFGISAEIAALAAEHCFHYLKAQVVRVALPDGPAPASASLEKCYYPTRKNLIEAAKQCLTK